MSSVPLRAVFHSPTTSGVELFTPAWHAVVDDCAGVILASASSGDAGGQTFNVKGSRAVRGGAVAELTVEVTRSPGG